MNEDAETKKAPPKSNAGEIPRPARDWLLILLTGSAGSIDAAVFLKSHVFTANMSGNTVLLGLGLARVQSMSVANTLFALCGFCFGAGIGTLIVQPLVTKRGWSHKVNQALSLAAFLLLASGFAASLPGRYAIPATIAAVAAAMGIQSASAQHLAVPGVSTNVITATLTTAVMRMANVLLFSHPGATKVDGPKLHFACWASYLLGAVVGGGTSQIGWWIPFGLSVVLLLAIVILSERDLRDRESPGSKNSSIVLVLDRWAPTGEFQCENDDEGAIASKSRYPFRSLIILPRISPLVRAKLAFVS
jgi:uncharacterized membrane protein YoaK (UPF0700 family)